MLKIIDRTGIVRSVVWRSNGRSGPVYIIQTGSIYALGESSKVLVGDRIVVFVNEMLDGSPAHKVRLSIIRFQI